MFTPLGFGLAGACLFTAKHIPENNLIGWMLFIVGISISLVSIVYMLLH